MSTALVNLSGFFYGHNEFMFVLSGFDFILGLFLSFVIVTKSKHLGYYKYYLLNQNIADLLLSIVLILGRPVALTPHYCLFLVSLELKMLKN
uniref:7TM_GPCR_Srx domain-containing protein n=1 Tax=Panagrellus redivivus TaxID=6233 RepID=A0A7E4V1E6_PANRE